MNHPAIKVPLWVERLNLVGFGAVGLSVAGFALSRILMGIETPYGDRPFRHSPETFMIAGIGLMLLCYKYKLYGFPLFMIVANLVELPWLVYSPFWNLLQMLTLSYGYILARPTFYNWVWVLVVILMNQPGSLMFYLPSLYGLPLFRFLYFHHIAEVAAFIVFLFNIKSLHCTFARWIR
jgi:hypothetical protein